MRSRGRKLWGIENDQVEQPVFLAEITQRLASLKLFEIKKRGFNPPLQPWLRDDLPQRFNGLGQRLEAMTNGQINAQRIEALVAEYRRRPALAEQILQLLVLDATLGQLRQLAEQA